LAAWKEAKKIWGNVRQQGNIEKTLCHGNGSTMQIPDRHGQGFAVFALRL
jgi:hypothetical protein